MLRFGLNPAELTKSKNAWLDIPNSSNVAAKMGLTLRAAI